MHAFRSHRRAACMGALCALVVVVVASAGLAQSARATLPPGNSVQQWDKIAEDTVVGSGAFQNEGLIYMAYVSSAMYRAVSPGERRGQSPAAAVVEAAFTTLSHYFPAQTPTLDALHTQALAAIPDSQAKIVGLRYGALAAAKEIAQRDGDGLQTPIASTSSFPTLPPGPGVWRLTPTAYLPPQTPWVANVRPFILNSAAQFLPPPPASLQSQQWVDAFNEIEAHGSNTNPSTAETTTARFWTANVIRQYNRLARDVATAKATDLVQTARLMAMVNTVGADAQISCMYAKCHYLFLRPVTSIDPTSG